MRKENGRSGTGSDISLHHRPLTRALASTLQRASGQSQCSQVATLHNQQRPPRPTTKRAALEEKKPIVPKKRAVLRDLTNITSDNSYNNLSKTQGKKARTSKVEPSVTSRVFDLQSHKASDTSEIPCYSSNSCIEEPQFQYHPASKEEKSDVAENLIEPDTPKFVDIDSDHRDPLLCSLYATDIYHNLRVAELKRRPYPDFMERIQKDITQSMRGILIDWLVEVSEEYTLVPDTLYLTVYLIDCFLHGNYIERQRLQLLGITCMLIASKYEEICAPRIEEFCFITDNTYTRDQVLQMESQVLEYFRFQIYTSTPKTFLRRFLRAAQASHLSSRLELEFLANYLTELTLMDYDFLKFRPSVIAASAVFLAKWTIDQSINPWNSTLEHYTTYKASDLRESVFALQDLHLNTKGCPLNAIRIKYRQEKFKSVAALSSPKLLHSLF